MDDTKKNARKDMDSMKLWQSDFAVSSDNFHAKMAELVASSPYSFTHLAECMGIGRTTLYRMQRRDPGLLMRMAVIQALMRLQ